MAPAGVATIQVDGTTIHTALGIPVGHFGTKLPPLHDKMKTVFYDFQKKQTKQLCIATIRTS